MPVYGLLGQTLAHSYSPEIHAMLGEYEYRLFEMEQKDLASFLFERAFGGINVTIPYKEAVMPFLDSISTTAKRIGSVNTILVSPDGKLHGENTDYYGFSYLMQKSGIAVRGRQCIVLGSGGSSKTVLAVLSDMGARELTVISRSGPHNYDNIRQFSGCDLIVNTTPVGMYPNNGISPVNLDDFPRCSGVIDLIYNPDKTELLLSAEQRGIPHSNGLIMLTAQAKRAFELFFGRTAEDGIIETVTDAIRKRKKNIVLTGMPGCGKSTVGARLAALLQRPFFDTDILIEQKYGRTPAQIITQDGEDRFRECESEVIRKIGKSSGAVIATGGGAVIRSENIRSLRQNGTIVFLNRPLQELATGNRPLSSDPKRLEELYRQRLPLYRSVCDLELPFVPGPDINAAEVIRLLRLT